MIKYPVGIQNFPEIIEEDYLYVDKTRLVYDLVQRNKYVFLSRPRRFGKSLLISTLQAYFQGRKELFKGLAIEELEQDWIKYPVLRMDLTGKNYRSIKELERGLEKFIVEWEDEYGLPHSYFDIGDRFHDVIRKAAEVSGRKVVVLIDEYDKPIIDSLESPELQEEIRLGLQNFYSVLKKDDEYIQFAMLTGVGKFAHLSIFSGLNNITDISMDHPYNAICGITEQEMHEYFGESVKEFAEAKRITEKETWAEFKSQYDGYHFCEDGEDIYNPFSVMLAFNKKRIDDYWFRSGTPSFLVKLLRRNRLPLIKLEGIRRSADDLSDMTDATRDIVPLMFQSGYLTLRSYDTRRRQYLLDFPNREVYAGFWGSLVKAYFPRDLNPSGFDVITMTDNLRSGDIDSFMTSIQSLIASATTDHIVNREEHFQNMMAIICRMLGLEVQTEIHGAAGRCDMTVRCPGYIYIFEFKIDSTPEAALRQIEEKGYANPYLSDPRQKILIGANFSTDTRTLTGYAVG